jgi:orotate phosphoribosyltransferase
MTDHLTKEQIDDSIKQAIKQHEREVNIKGFFLAGVLLGGIFHAVWLLRTGG